VLHVIYFSIKIFLLIHKSLTFVTLFGQASLGSNHLFRVDTWFDGLLHQDALLVKTEAARRRRTSF
jgi:hypothetical protein